MPLPWSRPAGCRVSVRRVEEYFPDHIGRKKLRIVPANQTAPIVPINGKINPAESFSNGIQGILHIVQMKPIAISYSVISTSV
jgi:hypothetical protein